MEQKIIKTPLTELEHIREYLSVYSQDGEVSDDWDGFLCCWHRYKHRNQIITKSGYKFIAFKKTAPMPKKWEGCGYAIVSPDVDGECVWNFGSSFTITETAISFNLKENEPHVLIFTDNENAIINPVEFIPQNKLERDIWDVLKTAYLPRGIEISTLRTIIVRLYSNWIQLLPRDERWMAIDSFLDCNDMAIRELQEFAEKLE